MATRRTRVVKWYYCHCNHCLSRRTVLNHCWCLTTEQGASNQLFWRRDIFRSSVTNTIDTQDTLQHCVSTHGDFISCDKLASAFCREKEREDTGRFSRADEDNYCRTAGDFRFSQFVSQFGLIIIKKVNQVVSTSIRITRHTDVFKWTIRVSCLGQGCAPQHIVSSYHHIITIPRIVMQT